MSYKAELADLKRDSERSSTEQIVAAIEGAIESGELTLARSCRRRASCWRPRESTT